MGQPELHIIEAKTIEEAYEKAINICLKKWAESDAPDRCEICNRKVTNKAEELRPFGEENKWICVECGQKDSEKVHERMTLTFAKILLNIFDECHVVKISKNDFGRSKVVVSSEKASENGSEILEKWDLSKCPKA